MVADTQSMSSSGATPTSRDNGRGPGHYEVGDEQGLRDVRPLDQALGWFSIGLGLMETLAPRSVGRLIGVGDHSALVRLCGLREIASGVGLLSERAPASSAMSRVAGDVMDLALLGAALRSPDAQPRRLLVAATTVLGVTALDVYAAGRHAREALAEAEEIVPIRVSLVISAPPEKLYSFWRDFENLPRFMRHLESVTCTDDRISHWVARAGAGARLEWDSEVVQDRPNELIAWRTLPDSEVNHHGSVRFEPAGSARGTIVRVEMEYGAPGGPLGARLAKVFGAAPESRIRQDLRVLKQLFETGEIATTAGQPAGARSLLGKAAARKESASKTQTYAERES
jgi:uncharacterized membrane protein